jgi:hypothetical protein
MTQGIPALLRPRRNGFPSLRLVQPICHTIIQSALAAGWENVLTQIELIQGAESRYQLYELDARARSGLKAIWPIIAPHLDKAIDAILDAAERLPLISATARS